MRNLLLSIFALSLSCSCVCENPPVDETNSLEQNRATLKGKQTDYSVGSDAKANLPSPPIQKPYPEGSVLIDLVDPKGIKLGKTALADAINNRRSSREYTNEKVSLVELSYLLWSTQGIQKIVRKDDGQVSYHLRTVPSGGGRHPFETYLLINRVEGIDPGVYRYLAVEHKLLAVYDGTGLKERIDIACFGQKFVSSSAVVFVWAAVPYRTEWKYNSVASKMIAIEAGHICQNLYLACGSVGLGTCAMMGYDQIEIDRLIGVDGKDEFTVYIAPVGRISEAVGK